ncbi:MAG: WD40 repeat domain-containing protein [Anaerolineae bacterium]|nr:WD40 repeat domain-containing protein [Anaerolineae bacterium]
MADQPGRKIKPKRKRKRDDSIIPYVAIFGVVVAAIVGVAGVFLLTREPQTNCASAGSDCGVATYTPLPYVLFPTPTPALPPNMVGEFPPIEEAPAISSLALAPDEQHLLVGLRYSQGQPGHVDSLSLTENEDGMLTFGDVIASYSLAASDLFAATDIDIQPDGEYFSLASELSQTVELYNYSAADLKAAIPNEGNSPITFSGYNNLAFSPNGRYFAIAGRDGISLIDAESLFELATADPNQGEPQVVDLVFNNTSTVLAVAHSETMTNNMSPYITFWSTENDQLNEIGSVTVSRVILDMEFSPKLNQIAIAMPGQIDIYDLDSQQHETYAIQETPAIVALTYDPTAGVLVFGGSHDAISGSVYAIPLSDKGFAIPRDTGININNLGFTSGPVSKLLYNASGRTLFVGTVNGGLFTWNVGLSRPYDDYIFH